MISIAILDLVAVVMMVTTTRTSLAFTMNGYQGRTMSSSSFASSTTTPCFISGRRSKKMISDNLNRRLVIVSQSTATTEETATTETTTSTTMESKQEKKSKAKPTRFDRLKSKYKGPTYMDRHKDIELSDENLDLSYEEFAAAVELTDYSFERNTVVQGVAVEYSGTGVMVDIGAKSSAYLPEHEVALNAVEKVDVTEHIPLDTPMDFQIISQEDENGQLIVSVKRILYRQAWETVIQLAAEDALLDCTVISVNRGGAICELHGLRAFLPGSHISGQLADDNLIGQTLPIKFLEVIQETGKLVVSNRKAVVEQQMADLSRGDVVPGVVKAIKPYGAFVEVGGMSGLLHISQISYDRIEDLEAVLQPGMQVKCMIIDYDKANGRIALSTKTLEPEPGAMLKDPQMVFDKADETAKLYHEKLEIERQTREAAAETVVMGLASGGLDFGDGGGGVGEGSDPLDELAATVAAAAATTTGGGSETGEEETGEDDPLKDVTDSLDSLLS